MTQVAYFLVKDKGIIVGILTSHMVLKSHIILKERMKEMDYQ